MVGDINIVVARLGGLRLKDQLLCLKERLYLCGGMKVLITVDCEVPTCQAIKLDIWRYSPGSRECSGGQTVMNPWLSVGGVATSICRPEEYILPDSALVGDVLVLTKPLGTQVRQPEPRTF